MENRIQELIEQFEKENSEKIKLQEKVFDCLKNKNYWQYKDCLK